MSNLRAALILVLLLVVCFTLATWLEPRVATWSERGKSGDLLTLALGDGRRMFANHFFTKADVYFHSGYYPSIFDQGRNEVVDAKHMTGEHGDEEEQKHERAMEFLGQPKDWIDKFGRNFYPSTHSHLDKEGEAREILPWLRLSADLDPQRIDTYTVAAYWLREHLGRAREAEGFLREGIRANPTSYELLYELGKLYAENKRDPVRACNLLELAVRRWQEQDAAKKNPDPQAYNRVLALLANLEEQQGNFSKAIEYLELDVKFSPFAPVIQKRIEELKAKLPK